MIKGLNGDAEELKQRKKFYGSNVIPPKEPKSFLELCWEAIQDATLIILMISATVSLILWFVTFFTNQSESGEGEDEEGWIDSVAILGSVVIVVLVTAFNDYAKERQFRGLQNKIAADHYFAVIRNGEVKQVPVAEIVVGDICQV